MTGHYSNMIEHWDHNVAELSHSSSFDDLADLIMQLINPEKLAANKKLEVIKKLVFTSQVIEVDYFDFFAQYIEQHPFND